MSENQPLIKKQAL